MGAIHGTRIRDVSDGRVRGEVPSEGCTLAVLAALAVYVFLIRPWHLRWGVTDAEVAAYLPGDDYETSWAFFLQPVDAHTTRLIERFRTDWGPDTFGNTFFYRGILEPGTFIMERKMLLGIKERVEAAAERSGG